MSQHSPSMFEFSSFRLDAEAFVLYHNNEIIREAEKHSLEVLAVLVSSPDQIATYDEIISRVWPDVEYGVDSSRVTQHISKLRGIFSSFEPEIEFFENLRGRGYRFTIPVSKGFGTKSTNHTSYRPQIYDAESAANPSPWLNSRKIAAIAAALVVTVIIGAGFWYSSSDSDEEEVARVIRESQIYESLVLYKNPELFQEANFDKYWAPDPDLGLNFDRTRIRELVKKLVTEGRRYGDESKCEQFDFQLIQVDKNGQQATARTLEKWSITEYKTNGELLKVKTVGPYFVDYIVRKIDGKWLVEKSNTARTVRPTPQIENIIQDGRPTPGKEFTATILGTDFEPVTAFVEVVGNGCPESKPCKVDNGALLQRSKLSATKLENVPFTLASGEYKIYVRNGDSRPSNAGSLTVP